MRNTIIKVAKILAKIIFAIIFGAMFWWFLEYFQLDIVTYKFSCCERCGNILFDREQPILAVCAGLAFFILAFLRVNDWKFILVTLAVAFLCFYPYWIFTFWTGHPRQECTALNYPRGSFPFINEIVMLIISGFWAGLCALPLLIIRGTRTLFYSEEAIKEEL
jgi:Ca2+/Na+ antiporter